MPESIDERVARGVAYLNERYPGWRDSINVGTLDMSNHEQCVLGQLGGFWDYWRKYPQWLWPTHGFGVDGEYGDYPALTAAWKKVLS